MLNYNITDIYITDEMGFELPQIHQLCAAKNCQVRVFPNVAQSRFSDTPDRRKFFIRPEAIPFYEDCVDICEIYSTHEMKQVWEIMYKVYALDKFWAGSLNEYLIGFEEPVPSLSIPLDFDRYRVICKKRCSRGRECHLCDGMCGVAQHLRTKGYVFQPPKIGN